MATRRTYDSLAGPGSVNPGPPVSDVFSGGRAPGVQGGVVEAFSAAYAAFEPIAKQLKENADKKNAGQANAFFVEHEEILQELLGAGSDYEQNQILNVAAQRGLVDASLIPHLQAHSVGLQISRTSQKLDAELYQAIVNEQQVSGHEDPTTGEWVKGKTFEEIWANVYPKYAATWAPRTEMGSGPWLNQTEETRTKYQKASLGVANDAQKAWGQVSLKEDIQTHLFTLAEDSPVNAPGHLAKLLETLDLNGRNGQDPSWKARSAETMREFIVTLSYSDSDGARNVLSLLQNLKIDGRSLGDGAQEPLFAVALATADAQMVDNEEEQVHRAEVHEAKVAQGAKAAFRAERAALYRNNPSDRDGNIRSLAGSKGQGEAYSLMPESDQGIWLETWDAEMKTMMNVPDVENTMILTKDMAAVRRTSSPEELTAFLEGIDSALYTDKMSNSLDEVSKEHRDFLQAIEGNDTAVRVRHTHTAALNKAFEDSSGWPEDLADNLIEYIRTEQERGLDQYIDGEGTSMSFNTVRAQEGISAFQAEVARMSANAKERTITVSSEIAQQFPEIMNPAAAEELIAGSGLLLVGQDALRERWDDHYKQWLNSTSRGTYREAMDGITRWENHLLELGGGSITDDNQSILAQLRGFRVKWESESKSIDQTMSPEAAASHMNGIILADMASVLPVGYEATAAYAILKAHPEVNASRVGPINFKGLALSQQAEFVTPGGSDSFNVIAGNYRDKGGTAQDVDILKRSLVHGLRWAKYDIRRSSLRSQGVFAADHQTGFLTPGEPEKDFWTINEKSRVDVVYTSKEASVIGASLGLFTIHDLKAGKFSVKRGNRASASHRKQAADLGIQGIGGSDKSEQAAGEMDIDITVIDPFSTPVFGWKDREDLKEQIAEHDDFLVHWGVQRGRLKEDFEWADAETFLKQLLDEQFKMGQSHTAWQVK